MKLIGGAALAAVMLVASGCGGSDKSPAEAAAASDTASVAVDAPTSPSASPTPKEVSAKPYFAALAQQDSEAMRRAAKAAASGSLARAYMDHQANAIVAALDAGEEVTEGVLTEKGAGFEICYPEEENETCYTYDKFKVDPAAHLAGFVVNGRSIAGRVVVGSGKKVQSSVASVTVLSAYQTTSGYLTVAVKIRTKATGVVFYDPTATYRAPSGQQRAVYSQSGLTDLGAHSQATQLFYFKGPLKFGGSITLQAATHRGGDDYGDATYITAKVG